MRIVWAYMNISLMVSFPLLLMFKLVLSAKIYLINQYNTFEIGDTDIRTHFSPYNTQTNKIAMSKYPTEAALLPWIRPWKGDSNRLM